MVHGCPRRLFPPPKPRVFWPTPPAPAKLEYIGTFYTEDQFPKSGIQRLVKNLFGKQDSLKFKYPFDVATDGQGKVYISDPGYSNIWVYDFNRKTVGFLSDQPIGKPYFLAVDSQQRLFVSDAESRSILVFSAAGKPLASLGGSLFKHPGGLALDEKRERLYVSDVERHEIVVIDLQGRHLFSFGRRGGNDGEFIGPQGLAVDREGNLFVVDALNARVQVFDPEGKFLRKFGVRGDAVGNLEGPRDLVFDSDGNLQLVDVRKAALLTYSPAGELLLYTGAGKATPAELGFAMPTGICIDSNDLMYVVDFMNKRFAIWQYLSAAYLQAHPLPAASGLTEAAAAK